MPINRPTTQTIISTAQWGFPITDEVNALRAELNAMKPTAWTLVTFTNGWVNAGASYPATSYRKIGDMVFIRGHIKDGTGNTGAFTLPAGFRPITNIEFTVNYYTGSMVASNLTVFATGIVNPSIAGSLPLNLFFSTI